MEDVGRELIDEQVASNLEAKARAAPIPGSISVDRLRNSRVSNPDGSSRLRRYPDASDRVVRTANGSVRTRVFPRDGQPGAVIHFHGGGWVLGSIYEQDDLLSKLASATGSELISVEYPLAPENILPKAVDVAAASLGALLDETQGPVGVLGESAGAHIALSSVILLRKSTRTFSKIRAVSLSYGIYDLSMTPSQRSWGDEFLGLSTPWLEWFYSQTLPALSRNQRSDPALSPLYSDLQGLPPVLLTVGARDPLLDDSTFLHQRLLSAGVSSELLIYPEAPHGFNHADTRLAQLSNERVAAFLKHHLATAGEQPPPSTGDR